MTTLPTTSSYLEQTRPQRVDALMWVAEHAGVLADAYSVSVTSGGEVHLQGERGGLQSLVARLDAVPNLDRDTEQYREWVTHEDGVRIRFVEEVESR